MKKIPLENAMLCYTPPQWSCHEATKGQATVVQHPDYQNKSHIYALRTGACFKHFKDATNQQKLMLFLLDFHHAVIRDKMDPIVMHKALLQVEGFSDVCAADVVGSTNESWF